VTASGGLDHPYGLVFDPTQPVVFTDSQDTGAVATFSSESWNFLGNITTSPSPRGLAVDPQGRLYLGDTKLDQVLCFDAEGRQLSAWTVENPISLLLGRVNMTDVLFVSSNDSKQPAVFAFRLSDQELIATFETPNSGLAHPAGMQQLGESLYVLGQDKQQILQFNTTDGTYMGKLLCDLPDAPEQMLFINC
jgi:DNA-binding beta-propeller fold protein YncE